MPRLLELLAPPILLALLTEAIRAVPAPNMGRRVLVVDDNRDAADTLARFFRMLGYETAVAYSGEDGLAAFLEQHPAFVFLDIAMPDLSGLEVARRIRAQQGAGLHPTQQGTLVMVAVTGFGGESDRRKSLAAGFDAHLTKPVDLAALQRIRMIEVQLRSFRFHLWKWFISRSGWIVHNRRMLRSLPQGGAWVRAVTISLVVIMAAAGLLPALPARETVAAPPDGFLDHLVTEGLSLPTDVAFAPDGRVFVTQQHGAIRVIDGGVLLPDPAITIPVGTGGDRGLLSLALDPSFSSNGYVYTYATSSSLRQRITRWTMTGNTIDPASALVLLENPLTWSGFLNAGAVRFGDDGKLYATLGSNGTGMGAQDLAMLEGKLLRINPDGSVPADNPFAATPGARSEIYSTGFRNPWRMEFGPDGKPIIGDVGEGSFEKIVRAEMGANYGWPTVEGDCRPSCGAITPPLTVIPHEGSGAAVVGGPVLQLGTFPAEYAGDLFFGDYVQARIMHASLAPDGSVTDVDVFMEEPALGALVGLREGPDGCLWYLTIFPGKLRRVCFGGASPVEAAATSDVSYGALPLPVAFSGDGSVGTGLTYAWTFGDGASSTDPNPSHTYTTQGVYTATLTVTDGTNTASESLTVWAGYLPPEVTSMAPPDGTTFNAGDVVAFAAEAEDPMTGEPLPDAAFTWRIYLHHNIHVHSPYETNGAKSGMFTIHDDHREHESDADVWYRFELIVTDAQGLSTVVSREIFPNTATLTLTTNPPGIPIVLDFQPTSTPYVAETVVGFTRTLEAPSPVVKDGVVYEFDFWSDGGAREHDIVMPAADASRMATYVPSDDPPPPPPPEWITTVAPNAGSVGSGEFVTLTTTVNPPASFGEAILDTEIYDASGIKVLQDFGTVTLVAGAPASRSWTFAAPAEGDYLIKVGVFAPGWSALHHWNGTAGTLLVEEGDGEPPPPPPGTWGTSVDPDDASVGPVAGTTLTTTVIPAASVGEVILDTEIYDASGIKVLQDFGTVMLTEGTPASRTWTFAAPVAEGPYTIKVGVFAPGWSGLYHWNGAAGMLTVTDDDGPPPPPPPPASFVVLGEMPSDNFDPGAMTTATTRVTATQDTPSVNILTEIYNESGTKVFGHLDAVDLTRNVQFVSAFPVGLPMAEGPYVMKIGVFNSDWSALYFWKDSAWRFTIGEPPGPPEPGETYDIEVLVPQDGSTVSGTVEIKARISELAIDTYNVAWRTGSGAFFFLDTDPVTRLFKHAWIDFGSWTWLPPGTPYPLEFQATNTGGTVIGGEVIHVEVVHE